MEKSGTWKRARDTPTLSSEFSITTRRNSQGKGTDFREQPGARYFFILKSDEDVQHNGRKKKEEGEEGYFYQ